MDRGRLTVKLDGLICLQCVDGYLSASGLEGGRLHLQSPPLAETGDEALPFFSFSHNVFRMVQTRSQALASAEKSSANAEVSNSFGDIDTKSTAAKEAAEAALRAVTEEPERPMDILGSLEITYGQPFSLVHADSGLYVSVAHSQPSGNDPDCVSVVLVSREAARSASCEFIFVSRYKIHSDGDNVCREDEVLIRLSAKPVFLHVSAPQFMDQVKDDNAADLEVLSRTYRLGGNISFHKQPSTSVPSSGASPARGTSYISATSMPSSPGMKLGSPMHGEQVLSQQVLDEHKRAQGGGDGGAVTPVATVVEHADAIAGLTRDFLDEVNGCEEGGIAFVLHRYDVGTDRANAVRNQLHLTRSYVACGVPLSFYHRERESFLTTSVSNPRLLVPNSYSDPESAGEGGVPLRMRRVQGDMSGVKAMVGAEGRIHASATAGAAHHTATGSPSPNAEPSAVSGAGAESSSMQSRADRAAAAAARAACTAGLEDVGAARRLPFPAFADAAACNRKGNAGGGGGSSSAEETSLSEMQCGANALWIIEAEDPTQGGPVKVQQENYRLKHVMTGLYLAVTGSAVDELFDEDIDNDSDGHVVSGSDDSDGSACDTDSLADGQPGSARELAAGHGLTVSRQNTGREGFGAADMAMAAARETSLCLIPEPRDAKDIQRTLFSFDRMFTLESPWLIEQECLIVKNTLTGMFLCTDNNFSGQNARMDLQWHPSVADTIVTAYVPLQTQRDALFLYNQCQTLTKFRNAMQAAADDKHRNRRIVEQYARDGNRDAQAVLKQWAASRASWESITHERMGVPDIDDALLKDHWNQQMPQHQEAPTGTSGTDVKPSPDVAPDYAMLYPLIRQCQDALLALLRFCQSPTEDDNMLHAEGLPADGRQRMLFDVRAFRLIFEVLLTPFCQLSGDPTIVTMLPSRSFHQSATAAGRASQSASPKARDAESSPLGVGGRTGGSAPGSPVRKVGRKVYDAVLQASQQRQVLTHSLWDFSGSTNNPLLQEELAKARLPAVPMTGGVMEVEELLLPEHTEIHLVCRLAVRLLLMMVRNNSAYGAEWEQYIMHCLALDGRRLHVVEMLKEVFSDNSHLSIEAVETVAAHFIGAAKSIPRAVYLDFLGAACTYRFRGFPQRQEFICRKLFCEHPELLSRFVMKDGVLFVIPDSTSDRCLSFMEFFSSYPDRKQVKFVINQIALSAKLCYHGTTRYCCEQVSKWISADMMVYILKECIWNSQERVGVGNAFDVLRSHCIRLAFQCFIVHKISDPARVLRVSTVLFGSSSLRVKDSEFYSGHEDDEMTKLLKGVTLKLLHANPHFVQDDVGRSTLLRAVVAVWFRLIRYRQYTAAEATELFPIFLNLLDGTQDVLSVNPIVVSQSRQASPDQLAADSAANARLSPEKTSNLSSAKRLELRKQSMHLMRIREMICQSLNAALENAVYRGADEVIVYLYNASTNPEAFSRQGKPWLQATDEKRSSSAARMLRAIRTKAVSGSAAAGSAMTSVTEATSLLAKSERAVSEDAKGKDDEDDVTVLHGHEATCCCGLCRRKSLRFRGSKKKKKTAAAARADGYQAVGSGRDEEEEKEEDEGGILQEKKLEQQMKVVLGSLESVITDERSNVFTPMEGGSEDDEEDEDSSSNSSTDSDNMPTEDDAAAAETATTTTATSYGSTGSAGGATRASPRKLVTAADIRAYLEYLNNRICDGFAPARLIPLLLDVTRYDCDQLTVHSMRLLVQLCVVRSSLAQMILTVNSLPSTEVVRSFDKIHDVAVELRREEECSTAYSEGWHDVIKVALGTLLDSFNMDDEDSSGDHHKKAAPAAAGGVADEPAGASAVAAAPPVGAEPTAEATPPRHVKLLTDLKDIYSSFAIAHREREIFGASPGSTSPQTATPSASIAAGGGGAPPSPQNAEVGRPVGKEGPPQSLRQRSQQLWAKTAGATRMLIYSNTIRSRRRMLGLSETSKTPMNLIVRAEMMAHWRIHETLLAMLPHVPANEKSFFRLMKFFYFFTLSESNCRLLRPNIQLFIDAIDKEEGTRAVCLNVVVAILGTMHDVNDYLSADLLSAFVQRVDMEAFTTIPDKEFIELLSDKIFSKSIVSVVVRRRMMLILREHGTLLNLSRPRTNPTEIEVAFISALVNLVCNVCGTSMSVLTLAQRMLTSPSICRIVLQRFEKNPFGVNVEEVVPRLSGSLRASSSATVAKDTHTVAASPDGGGGGKSKKEVAGAAAAPAADAAQPKSPPPTAAAQKSAAGGAQPPVATATGEHSTDAAMRESNGFRLINPYLRALVSVYFTTPEDNPEDRRMRQADWTASAPWWDIIRLMAASLAKAAGMVRQDQGKVENKGLDMLEGNRAYFLASVPITVAAYFLNCYHRDVFTKYQPTLIKDSFDLIATAAAAFSRVLMANVDALVLTVEEMVNYRRLLGVIEFIGARSGFASLQKVSEDCHLVKEEMRSWLSERQKVLHARVLQEQANKQRLGIGNVNDDDVGVFDILFREEAVSSELQRVVLGGGKGLLLSSATATDAGAVEVRAALRASLRSNTIIQSPRHRPCTVTSIINALLLSSVYYANVRESLRKVLMAIERNLFSPRTFVGLLNLFYNSLDTALRRFTRPRSLEVLRKKAAMLEFVEKEAPAIAPEWEAAQAAEKNHNSSIMPDTLAYGLQIVYNKLGMMRVVVTLCGIDDDVVTHSAVRLGVRILEGGNSQVQSSLLDYFLTREENFFHSVRDILRTSLRWAERVNAEHQYFMLKRGNTGNHERVNTDSANVQLVDGLKPENMPRDSRCNSFVESHGVDGRGGARTGDAEVTTIRLTGWGRVRGSRRVKLITRIFRLLQLFCEGHESGMQNYVRAQRDNLHSANMVHESATLLNELSLFVTPANIKVVTQGFDLLTEVCQGPCRANQEGLISYDTCSAIGHCLTYLVDPAVVIGDASADRINTLDEEAVGDLRTSISTTALALIEGCRNPETFQKMLSQLSLQDIESEISSVKPSLLQRITSDERFEHHPRAEALFNWLIYLYSVLPYATELQSKQIAEVLRRTSAASRYLGSVEINREDGLERVYFRIPQICMSLTQERKDTLLWSVDRTSRATKLADFLHKSDEVIFAVEQQHDLARRVRRLTRYDLSYDPDENSVVQRTLLSAKTWYNHHIAHYLFSYETNYYESVSMVVAVLVNFVLVLFEGARLQSRIGRLLMKEQAYLVSVLCLMQIFVSAVLLYGDVTVAYPVHLYTVYKEKLRLASGKAKFNVDMREVYAGLTIGERMESFLGYFTLQFRIFLLTVAVLSVAVSPYFAAFNLMLLIYKISTLRTFITAITANGKQLLLTALLGVLLVYLFSIIGFLVFSKEYDPDATSPDDTNCDSLARCFLYILNQALRAGGGVGDVMRPWSWSDSDVAARMTYDMLFYALVTVVFLNIMFGIIIDTFGQMRDEKREKEEDMHGLCFICGLDNDTLEKTGVSGFQTHVKGAHNMWMYLYFMNHLRRKEPSEYTGQESYVNNKIQASRLDFFPNGTCLSLLALGEDGDSDSDSDREDEGNGADDGGADNSGKEAKGKGKASDFSKELVAARAGLAAFMKELAEDSARVKALLAQMELSARGAGGGGSSSAFGTQQRSGDGGGDSVKLRSTGVPSLGSFSQGRTVAPDQSRHARTRTGSGGAGGNSTRAGRRARATASSAQAATAEPAGAPAPPSQPSSGDGAPTEDRPAVDKPAETEK